jgi:hypothetical protein
MSLIQNTSPNSSPSQGKKCGHCRELGHNIGNCLKENEFAEEILEMVLQKLTRDIREAAGFSRFESGVRFLNNSQYRSLSKLVLELRYFPTERNDTTDRLLFNYFESLNIGYSTVETRTNRIIVNVEQTIQTILATQANILAIDNYLKNIPLNDLILMYRSILKNQSMIGSEIMSREVSTFREQRRIQPDFMLTEIFHMHCYFSEKYGYEFQVCDMSNYIDPSVEIPNIARGVNWILDRDRRRENHRVQRANLYRPQTVLDGIYYPSNGHDALFEPTESVAYPLRINCVITVPTIRLVSRDFVIQKQTDLGLGLHPVHECPVCIDSKSDSEFMITGCNHAFCGSCIAVHMRTLMHKNRTIRCPLCRETIREIHYKDFSVIRNICNVVHLN